MFDILSDITLPMALGIVFIAFIAGFVKGTVGFAMPMILVSGLGSIFPPEIALAAMIVPTLVSNMWQAFRQGSQAALASARRHWRYLAILFVVIVLSAQLVTILTQPKNALVKQYQRLFELEDTQLSFTEDALSAIAKRAIERKTGARGLRSILEEILLDTMFDLPGMDSVNEVVVNEEAVTSDAKPLMIHAEADKEPATAG